MTQSMKKETSRVALPPADRPALNIASFCTGCAGLELGVHLALDDLSGRATRTVCYVEREAFAAAILARRMEEKALDPAPIWSDLHTFDGRPWRGLVDLVTGGYPCQPFSFAGRRLGEKDPRHLWPSIARIIAEMQPGVCFFENVAGHISLGFPDVRRELERLGYRVTAGLFTAEEAGAPHKRERLFILAVASDPSGGRGVVRAASGRDGRAQQDGGELDESSGGRRERDAAPASQEDGSAKSKRDVGKLSRRPRGSCRDLADAPDGKRRRGERGEKEGARAPGLGGRRSAGGGRELLDGLADSGRERSQGIGAAGSGEGAARRGDGAEVADAANLSGRVHEGRGRSEPGAGVARGTGFGPFPPPPSDVAGWRRILAERPDLAPATQPALRGVADGMAGRLDRLRGCGNGVVPLAAAYAFVTLWACLHPE